MPEAVGCSFVALSVDSSDGGLVIPDWLHWWGETCNNGWPSTPSSGRGSKSESALAGYPCFPSNFKPCWNSDWHRSTILDYTRSTTYHPRIWSFKPWTIWQHSSSLALKWHCNVQFAVPQYAIFAISWRNRTKWRDVNPVTRQLDRLGFRL